MREVLACLAEYGLAAKLREGDPASGRELVVHIEGPGGSTELSAQVKDRVTRAAVNGLVQLAGARPILLARSIPDSAARLLRELEVPFVDSAGNAWLRFDGTHIDVRGRHPERTTPSPARGAHRAFQASGLKTLLVLLSDPSMVNASMREIGSASGVSIGSVHAVFAELEVTGFLLRAKGMTQLLRRGQLLDEWAAGYALNLNSKLTIAEFRTPDQDWWRNAVTDLADAQAQLGGESAADLLGGHLVASKAVVYAPDLPHGLARRFGWRKPTSEIANVEVRRKFWHLANEGGPLVPEVLIYADLLAAGDSRLPEEALRLRRSDERLAQLDRS
ncbi:MAG: type IV toxin-antitoxin system AbiEi family antitoxin [Actinomycetota bacterium]|nr:type IV toxin-antitoxin system AbiEi family antitoxin [Actinomycetota bacterium]